MISVIIPALNEEASIASVVDFAKQDENVTEILVIDDKSVDSTARIAIEHGAKVIESTKLGKGVSMKEGVMFSKNEIIVFLDADINPYPTNTIKLLSDPIISEGFDFVKSTFNRNAGRVTELVAKPLLSMFFPELLKFNQPLSGMIAVRKKLFESITLSDDYGVDIGILIDMYLRNAKIIEVEIGYIENKSKPWQALGKMSKEVAQTIIMKAAQNKNPNFNFEALSVVNEIRSQMEYAIRDQLLMLEKLMIFDMDNTLIKGRFIDICAEKFSFKDKLMEIRFDETDPIIRTKLIAKLLEGRSIQDLLEIVDSIEIVDDAKNIIQEMKNRGYIVGIVSDSYDCITQHIKNKLDMDFALSNELEFSKSICTGEVKLPSFFFSHSKSICKHSLCKTNAVLTLLDKYKIKIENTIAIGDSLNDLCMIKQVGLGISFCTTDDLVRHHADLNINDHSFSLLLDVGK